MWWCTQFQFWQFFDRTSKYTFALTRLSLTYYGLVVKLISLRILILSGCSGQLSCSRKKVAMTVYSPAHIPMDVSEPVIKENHGAIVDAFFSITNLPSSSSVQFSSIRNEELRGKIQLFFKEGKKWLRALMYGMHPAQASPPWQKFFFSLAFWALMCPFFFSILSQPLLMTINLRMRYLTALQTLYQCHITFSFLLVSYSFCPFV